MCKVPRPADNSLLFLSLYLRQGIVHLLSLQCLDAAKKIMDDMFDSTDQFDDFFEKKLGVGCVASLVCSDLGAEP